MSGPHFPAESFMHPKRREGVPSRPLATPALFTYEADSATLSSIPAWRSGPLPRTRRPIAPPSAPQGTALNISMRTITTTAKNVASSNG